MLTNGPGLDRELNVSETLNLRLTGIRITFLLGLRVQSTSFPAGLFLLLNLRSAFLLRWGPRDHLRRRHGIRGGVELVDQRLGSPVVGPHHVVHDMAGKKRHLEVPRLLRVPPLPRSSHGLAFFVQSSKALLLPVQPSAPVDLQSNRFLSQNFPRLLRVRPLPRSSRRLVQRSESIRKCYLCL